MDTTFAERFDEALKIRDVKPAEFARKTGISESVISQYRSGRYVPKQKRLELFSELLQVSIPWLMGGDTPMELPQPVSQIASAHPLMQIYDNLNKLGQERLMQYAEDLSGNDKYKKCTDITENIG